MAKYKVLVIETLSKEVVIEANSAKEAKAIANDIRSKVEVDLKQMKVVQCYGACDKFTLYHDRIVNLVNNNMNMIKQCMTSKQIAI